MATEAVGLPGPISRLARLGIRNPEQDYDERLWHLIGPFVTSLADPGIIVNGPRRERAIRAANRLIERLAASNPPSLEWSRIRDGYVAGVRATRNALTRTDSAPPPPEVWQAAVRELVEPLTALRAGYTAIAPPSPPWSTIVLAVTLPFTALGPIDVADYAYETITAPPVAADWAPMPMPMNRGDSWGGNAVSDGQRLYLVSRDSVQGFWGVINVRSSSDGGLTWTAPSLASLDNAPNQARPTIAFGPDGAVWVAFAHQGLQVATQFLQVGRSTDRGATWRSLLRVSPSSIGLIGLPQLLITPAVRLVAYTDGTTGEAIVQSLGPDGHADGAYSVLGTTTRELYSDAQFLDAGFSLAAAGRHVVALWHSSDRRLEVAVSDDAGRTWRAAAPISTKATWDRPHVFVSGGRFVALVDLTDSSGSHSWLELDSSGDGGMTWGHGPVLSNGLIAIEGIVSARVEHGHVVRHLQNHNLHVNGKV